MQYKSRQQSARHGGILLTTLVIAVVIATALAGLGTLVISYYSRVATESLYANSINMADAGINYELRRITQNVNNADLPSSGTPAGSTVSFGTGNFRVYCTMIDGSTSWDRSSSPFYVYSYGTIGSTTRTVQIKAVGTNSVIPNFGAFGTSSLSIDSSSCKISGGDIGCNGSTYVASGCQVPNGKCYTCGSSATLSGGFTGTCASLPSPCSFPTCSQYATQCFPNSGATAPGGLSYLSTHNDNASNGLSSFNASITASCTLTGPCNVYVKSIYLTGSSTITCNNNNGPCNIYVASGTGTCHFEGNCQVTCSSATPSKACTILCANTPSWQNNWCSCDVHDNCNMNCNLYCCNGGSGSCQIYDTPTINGSTIGDACEHHGATQTTTVASIIPPSLPFDGYAFGKTWSELNGM